MLCASDVCIPPAIGLREMANSRREVPLSIGLFNPFLDISLVLRQQYQDMTMVQASVLCSLWENKDASQSDIAKRIGVREATVSRAVSLLSKYGTRNNTLGLGLIQMDTDPADRRHRVYTFTPKGQSVMGTLEKLLRTYYGSPPQGR
jgi:DNA-binding MarR family transcriptional regulator